jgi:hypothetical protein
MKMTSLVCPVCKDDFERATKEVNRWRRKDPDRVFYCGRKCSGKAVAKNLGEHLGVGRVEHLPLGRAIDEFSPFRYYMKKARNRLYDTDMDLPFLRDLWSEQGGRCALSGIVMELPRSTGAWTSRVNDPLKPSLDRIDNAKGYLKGNVRFVTVMANLARGTFTDDQVVSFCRAVVQEHGLRPASRVVVGP